MSTAVETFDTSATAATAVTTVAVAVSTAAFEAETAATAVAIVAVAVSLAAAACATSVVAVAIALFTACCAGLTTTCSAGAGGSSALAYVGPQRKRSPNKKALTKEYLILDTVVATTVAASANGSCVELSEEACGPPPDDALEFELLLSEAPPF